MQGFGEHTDTVLDEEINHFFLCRDKKLKWFCFAASEQGDQIVRIFAHWVTDYFL
jgi:hypothetical protein